MNSLLRTLALAVLSCLLLALSGCPQDQNVILLEVTSPEDLQDLSVTIVPLDGSVGEETIVRTVNRTADDIATRPVRMVIALQAPRDVLVNITADAGGTRLFAQRCFSVVGTVQDSVLLVVRDGTTDRDDDGYPGVPSSACARRGADGMPVTCAAMDPFLCSEAGQFDCMDSNPDVNPGATDICGRIDRNCDGVVDPCGDEDMDGFPVCEGTQTPTCDCDDRNAAIHPGAADRCGDLVDGDCDGVDDLCDRDCDGYPSGVPAASYNDCFDPEEVTQRELGAQRHPNDALSTIVGLADGDRLARGCPAMPTVDRAVDACAGGVGDGIDQDCNGYVDDGPMCGNTGDRDRDGSMPCAVGATGCDINDCDPGYAADAIDHCGNGIDEDGSGADAVCDPRDMDRDGRLPLTAGGDDCDDSDPRVFGGAPEKCDTTESESCLLNVACDGQDPDGDGYRNDVDCGPMDPQRHPWAVERFCDGTDDDCDGTIDEAFESADGTFSQGRRGCVINGGRPAEVRFDATLPSWTHCGGCGLETGENQDCCAGVRTDVNVPSLCGGCGATPVGAPSGTGVNDCGLNTLCLPVATSADGTSFDCACAPLRGDCDGSLEGLDGGGNGCEVNLATDAANCGACGAACGINQHCELLPSGAPGCVCNAGFTDCDGALGCEADLAISTTHCGGCGRMCSLPNATPRCDMGTCGVATCVAGFGDCNGADGCETDIRVTNTSCGGCLPANDCTALPNVQNTSCSMGSCQILACASGFTDCDGIVANGCETHTAINVSNCGTCGNVCTASNGRPECMGGVCGVSSCNMGFANCDGDPGNGCERNLTNDATSCGMCGMNCPALPNTTAGRCTASMCAVGPCSPGFAHCDASIPNGCETNLNTTLSSCGACGTVCPVRANTTGPTCTAGVCGMGACAAGFANCDGNAANGCEVNLNTSPNHCGACGQVCDLPNAVEGCSAGSCTVMSCAAGFGNCDGNAANGCEVDLRTSATHCGTCMNACPVRPGTTLALCTASTCSIGPCDPGLGNCDGTLANGCEAPLNTVTNCGACGTNCPTRANATATCSGSCGFTCNANFADCNGMASDGCEVDLRSSPTNCDACGAVCPGVPGGTATCNAGTCGYSCNATRGDCNGLAADGCEVTLTALTSCGMTCASRVDCVAEGVARNQVVTSCNVGRMCVFGACSPSNFANCDTTSSDCETNLASATTCGTSCATDVNCTEIDNASMSMCGPARTCLISCNPGFGDCTAAAGCETNLMSSVNRCGACGNDCAALAATRNRAMPGCSSGTCTFGGCLSGFGDCDANPLTCEASLQTDEAHCGACLNACGTGEMCSMGTCVGPDSGTPDAGAPDASVDSGS